jgi:hypothetical protein
VISQRKREREREKERERERKKNEEWGYQIDVLPLAGFIQESRLSTSRLLEMLRRSCCIVWRRRTWAWFFITFLRSWRSVHNIWTQRIFHLACQRRWHLCSLW